MDVRTWLAQNVLVPLYERKWGIHPGSLSRSLEHSQYASPDEVRQLQWQAIRDVVGFALDHNPFYRKRFGDSGFELGDLREWEAFEKLPVLTKDDLRDSLPSLISEGHSRERMFHKRTGGSTGVPVHLYWDDAAHRFKRAVVKRHDAWAGYRLGVKRAALWGDTDHGHPWNIRLYKTLCERTIYLDTLKMDDRYLRDFVERARRFRPEVLIGHAHSLFFLAEYLVSQGIEDLRFRSIISTAETLSHDERAVIEDCFGPVLFDRYGCEEVSLIASECEAHDGMHVCAEGLYVEVVGGSGETPGRILVTDLVNRGMPFIRYEIGDLATVAPGRCSCGRGLPRLQRVYGRTSEMLYTPDGRRVSGISILDTFMIHIPGIRQAQIIQDAIDHVRIRVVRSEDWSSSSARHLASAVEEVFGSAMTFDVENVPRIEPTPRGKYQFSICRIDPGSDVPVTSDPQAGDEP